MLQWRFDKQGIKERPNQLSALLEMDTSLYKASCTSRTSSSPYQVPRIARANWCRRCELRTERRMWDNYVGSSTRTYFCGLSAAAYRTAVNHEATASSCAHANTLNSSGHLNTTHICSKIMENAEDCCVWCADYPACVSQYTTFLPCLLQ
jgi:hypothetical protein